MVVAARSDASEDGCEWCDDDGDGGENATTDIPGMMLVLIVDIVNGDDANNTATMRARKIGNRRRVVIVIASSTVFVLCSRNKQHTYVPLTLYLLYVCDVSFAISHHHLNTVTGVV
jgi:hypothetical protein